ncbi:uncharacterized protein LOC128875138 [Hylaeus volcanicus]|uniref:uncharacterized protein LOC128875138 n=1 Tax=Hylaeus volcanicus TaxID=313075 RepID=UPI0023B80CDC|nr:uncharacterized protein LOC128875138 [Hylaeus volcanicus]
MWNQAYTLPDSSPNLMPLLFVHDGPVSSEIAEKTSSIVSFEQLRKPSAENVSQSNYVALKSTDDMFKGGSEQTNITQQKLRGPSTIGTTGEWRAQKVSGARDDATAKKDAASWSLTGRRQYIDTDSRSPYENRKYLEPRSAWERVQNADREKQTVISSRDFHESFVEPLDWTDDLDEDVRVRLGRGLKTVEDVQFNTEANASLRVEPTLAENKDEESSVSSEQNLVDTSTEITRTRDFTSKLGSETSELAKLEIANSPSDLQNPPWRSNARVKRAIDSSYETFYDETNRQLDSEKMDYDRYSKNTGTMDNRVQLSNSYGNANGGYPNLLDSNSEEEEYDSPADDESHDLKKASRSVKSKKRDKHKKRNKHHGETLRKQKRKNHVDKSKYSENGRKRRRHKKHSSDSKTKHTERKKHKKRTSKASNRHANVKKSKASRDEDKVHGDRRRVAMDESKARRGEVESENTMIRDGDNQRKRISLLLAADDVEDESQMDAALHGELAGKIVDQIFEQVQKNEDLKASLGPGLHQSHKIDDVVKADKSYQQSVDDDEIKHTEDLMKRVMILLNRLIYDEVQRKTCVSLSPDLTEFLDWILDVNSQDSSLEQMPLRPLVHGGHSSDHFPRDKFLFQALPDMGMQDEIAELYKKLQLIENLIKEYNTLSEKDKTKVQTVHDYMAKQLDQLLEYIEAKKDGEKKAKSSIMIGAAVVKPGQNVQYRTEIRNTSSWTYSTEPNVGYGFSPVMSMPNMLKLGNASLLEDGEYFRDDGMDFHGKRRRVVRSADEHPKQRKKHKNRKKRKRKHRKRHKGASAIDQSERKDSVHKATPSRQKRGYLDKDFWESFHSGYEQPLIFTSMDMTNVKPSDNGGKFRIEKEDSRKKGANKLRLYLAS